MVDQAQIVRVVVASPGDLEPERRAIPDLFVRWNRANAGIHLTPDMWETGAVPTYGDHPQHVINEQIIEQGDLLVALFWTKIGSPTPTAKSGTIEEIRVFARRKGPKRVMVYFCTRPVSQSPDDIDHTAIALLKEFKAEMRSICLYQEFSETAEFEKHLYHHLDIKTDQLLRGLLPVPNDQHLTEDEDVWWNVDAPDKRLRQPIDFGTSIRDVASRFAARMDDFDSEDGSTNNKFFDLGAHVYRSAARAIDRVLQLQPYEVDVHIRPALVDIVSELCQLANDSSSYLERPFPEFWDKGRTLSDRLSATADLNSISSAT